MQSTTRRQCLRSWPVFSLRQQPWPPSPALAGQLDPLTPLEEEKTPLYKPERFYPARLGQVLEARYQLATKIGYGSGSTVWLARDLHRWRWSAERYVAVKILVNSHHSREQAAESELSILQHVAKANPRHEGWHFVRKPVDSFVVDHDPTSGQKESIRPHVCLVFKPMREPLWLYCRRYIGKIIPPEVLKIILRMILLGLDYLHSECHVIHTDLKPDNILVRSEDAALFARDARDEYDNPLPQKRLTDENQATRTIYLSRNNYGPLRSPAGVIEITDFDLSVRGGAPRFGCIQAECYRAPEVILDSGYTASADIWSLGVMIWDLLEGERLFDLVDPKTGEYDDATHLAEIHTLLGPPPQQLVENGRRAAMFYQPDRLTLKDHSLASHQRLSLEDSVRQLQGDEKRLFLTFARKMLCWDPEARSTAKELLQDPWLYTD